MKLQGFSIIFALVALPIILVLTYYVQLQVDTITLQNEYDSKLLDATYDAMSSFEINTANEDLSSVSDSLRTIINASSNVFFNTLSTNLGLSNASKSYVEPYVPAILYTLYDGYYIYSPTQVPTILTNSNGVAVHVGDDGVGKNGNDYTYTQPDEENPTNIFLDYDDTNTGYGQLLYKKNGVNDIYTVDANEAELKTENILKSYMPYSARYKGADFDVTIIYTLDNFITIEGTIKEKVGEPKKYIYYTKSGYLLSKEYLYQADGTLKNIINPTILLEYNQEDAEDYIKNGNPVQIVIDDTIIETPGETYTVLMQNLNSAENELNAARKNNTDTTVAEGKIRDVRYKLSQMSAVIYYTKAAIFSDWVYQMDKGLSEGIKEKHLVAISNQDYSSIRGVEKVTYDFSNSELRIFDTVGNTSNGISEVDIDSVFYKHKMNIIRNSIQYNLNTAMSTYNRQTANENNYEMPVLQNEEWDQILNNVSIVSFMQGYACGLKTYNNYKVVSSTNNEISVLVDNIYYVKAGNFSDEITEYHKIDCPKFVDSDDNSSGYMSFLSKDVKYDKIYNKNATNHYYEYDHKNLACYDCINDGNYENKNIFEKDLSNSYIYNNPNLRKAYYMGVGSKRNDLYKMNAIEISQGYEIICREPPTDLVNAKSSLNISEIKSLEIVLGKIKSRNSIPLRYEYFLDGVHITENFVSIPSINPNSSKNTTLIINLDPNEFVSKNKLLQFTTNFTVTCDSNDIYLNTMDETTVDAQKAFNNAIKYIRVIYK